MKTLREQVERFVPCNEQEERDKAILLHWLDSGEDILTRKNEVAHLTASAWVMSPDRSRVLMAYHNLYDSWAWLGGHADGEADLLAVACREAEEESGVSEVRVVTNEILSIETLCVQGHEKRGKYVPCHLHLNVTYLLEADPAQALTVKPDENSAVAWIAVEDIPQKSTEQWFVERIYPKLCEKAKNYPSVLR